MHELACRMVRRMGLGRGVVALMRRNAGGSDRMQQSASAIGRRLPVLA
jgi:hypothetical protein